MINGTPTWPFYLQAGQREKLLLNLVFEGIVAEEWFSLTWTSSKSCCITTVSIVAVFELIYPSRGLVMDDGMMLGTGRELSFEFIYLREKKNAANIITSF